MKLGRDASRADIIEACDALLGKTAEDISENIHRRASPSRARSKQAMGQLVETDYFGIPQNSDDGPDFRAEGIELKVTPLNYTGDDSLLRPKERMKIGSVDFHDIVEADHWSDVEKLEEKLEEVLIIWYIHTDAERSKYPVIWWTFWSPSDEQSKRMQQDFEKIKDCVEQGKRLRTRIGNFLGTFSSNPGGFDKDNPPASDPKSLVNSHPTREYEQGRAWEIKTAGVLEILEDAIDESRTSRNGATGIDRDTLWQFAKQRSTDNIEKFRINRTLEEFVDD